MKSLTLLTIALLAAPAIGQQPSVSKARISIPGVTGVLEMDVGPTTWEARVRADGKETELNVLYRHDNLRITAFVKKIKFPASSEKWSAGWWPISEIFACMKPK